MNVLDISQTVMNDYFTMMMVVDTEQCAQPFDTLSAAWRTMARTGDSVCAFSVRIFSTRLHKI